MPINLMTTTTARTTTRTVNTTVKGDMQDLGIPQVHINKEAIRSLTGRITHFSPRDASSSTYDISTTVESSWPCRLSSTLTLLSRHFVPNSNNVDVIVFSVHPRGSQKQCADDPMGTYIAPVPYFMNGYLQEIAMEMNDQGYEYQVPSAAQFIACTPYQFNGQQYYFQLGCADGTTQALAVNIYSDNTCTTRSLVDGYDDSNIDVSSLQVRSFRTRVDACVSSQSSSPHLS